MLRVDAFWYTNNEGNPAGQDGFFKQFWDLFRANNIPFRLHWGKFLPEYDFQEWAVYFRSQYPRWDDFMKLRAQRDPKNIFLTDYWRRHLLGE
jgi:D-arabinono-1,4-lactone oxidase